MPPDTNIMIIQSQFGALTHSQSQASEWASAKDKTTGDTYYYHKVSRNVSWDPPPGTDNPLFCTLSILFLALLAINSPESKSKVIKYRLGR